MNTDTIEALKRVSVATLSTVLLKKGLRHQVVRSVRPVAPKGRNMVGPAFTLRTIPAREDRNDMAAFRDPRHPQRQAIETCPQGHVLVVDSRKDPLAASAGDILLTRLMVRGVAGFVTDGGLRDAAEIARMDFPAYHQCPAPLASVTRHEAVEANVPVACGDAPVFPGDMVVGDDDAVIIVPAHLAEEAAAEALEMTAYEDFALERVRAGHTIVGLYPPTEEDNLALFAEWRKTRGR